MKAFLPFLLIPIIGMAGWGMASWVTPDETATVPTISAIDAPPSLGQPAVKPLTEGPVRVLMTALLPPAVPVKPEVPSIRQPLPEVAAILIHGSRRVAQIDGMSMVVGESRGVYRVAAIEPDRVLFVQTPPGSTRWVSVTDR